MKTLKRKTFSKSRLMDYCSEIELIKQTGHQTDSWPLVVLKELMDNSLDACEEAGIVPDIKVKVDRDGISVRDNGPGLKAATIRAMLDFTIRVSSREAFVAPDRGRQGNALKTILAMPFALDGKEGRTDIFTGGVHHQIHFKIDHIGFRNDFKIATPTGTMAVKGTEGDLISDITTDITGNKNNGPDAINHTDSNGNTNYYTGDDSTGNQGGTTTGNSSRDSGNSNAGDGNGNGSGENTPDTDSLNGQTANRNSQRQLERTPNLDQYGGDY